MNEIAKILERIHCCISKIENSTEVDLTGIITWLQTISTTLTEILNKTPTGSNCEDPTFVSVCNPTDLVEVENLLTSVTNKLDQVNTNLDELEITADQINLNADQINLNTDGIEEALGILNNNIQNAQRICNDPLVKPLSVNVCNSNIKKYNIPFVKGVPSGTTETMINDIWHSISVVCVKPPVSIVIGVNTISMITGMTLEWTADTLISDVITISSGAGAEAIITAMN